MKRDTPTVSATSYASRYSAANSTSAVPKPEICISEASASKTGQLKRYGSTSSNLGKYSREPSPAALEHTNRIKSRDPSPATRSLRGKSRDPSPALDNKSKIGYGCSSTAYKLNVPKSSSGIAYGSSRYSSSNAARTPTTSTSSASISYLSASDFKARSLSKAKEAATRKSNEKDSEGEEVEEPKEHSREENVALNDNATSSDTEEEDDEKEQFVFVTVCTRGTSPTPPGAATASTVHRTRRIEIAKTIEKTIKRSMRKKRTLEKEIQSDRLDDSTRYSRFGLSSRVPSSYSPHTDRYTSSSLRYSHSPLSISAKSSSVASSSDSKKDEVTSSSTTSTSSKSNKLVGNSKLKLSPPKSIKQNSRQSSVENLSAQKPPAAPKAESPTKSLTSSSSLSSKLPNKDFRKSALNVGPTDRPRKSRTPSTGTDSDLNTVEALNGALQAIQRLERSPSAGSEVSNASNRSTRRSESKLRPKCHNKVLPNGTGTATASSSPKGPLSRANSNTNIKIKLSCSASSTATTHKSAESSINTTTATSSSSGTESCLEIKKPNKKIAKKKSTKDVTTTSTSDNNNLKSYTENSFSQQPPVVSQNKGKKSESSTNSRATSKTPSEKDPLKRLKKLSSVSNFFAAQQQESANSDEQIYLESSENSTSGNGLNRTSSRKSSSLAQANETKTTPSPAFKKNSTDSATSSIDELKDTIATKSNQTTTSSSKVKSKSKTKSKTNSSPSSISYCPQDTTTVNGSSRMPSDLQTESMSTYTTTNLTTSSTSGTDQDDSSWWQDTSRQINTASALTDFNLKDDMRFKIRHIDSGETAWWLRNDDDDTLADDDLKTLNQADELEDEEVEDDEEATDQLKSLTSSSSGKVAGHNDKKGWWINETNEVKPNEDELDVEANYRIAIPSYNSDTTTNGYCREEEPVEAKPFPKSRLTPETGWWLEENEADNNEYTPSKSPSSATDHNNTPPTDKSAKQNGSIKLNICHVESGETPWWLQDKNSENSANQNEVTVEATIALPNRNKSRTDSSPSNSENKSWWMAGPTKKLFNIQKVESGEKAWWQEDASETKSECKPQQYKRNNSQEREWWLDEAEAEPEPEIKQFQRQNGYYEQPEPSNTTREDTEIQQYQQSSNQFANPDDAQTTLSNSFNFEYSERPPPLGQCASPVQQEESLTIHSPQHQQQQPRQLCKSPYDNIPMTKVQTVTQQPILDATTNFINDPNYQQYRNQSPQQQQQLHHYISQQQQHQNYLPAQFNNNDLRSRNGQLFISRHHNIDELLGGSCRPVSPLFYESASFQAMPPPPPPQQRNMFVEEITPDQVRIHDSTAQIPIIQRMER